MYRFKIFVAQHMHRNGCQSTELQAVTFPLGVKHELSDQISLPHDTHSTDPACRTVSECVKYTVLPNVNSLCIVHNLSPSSIRSAFSKEPIFTGRNCRHCFTKRVPKHETTFYRRVLAIYLKLQHHMCFLFK